MIRIIATPLRYVISFGLLLLMWHAAVAGFHIPPYLLPEPGVVLETLQAEWPSFLQAAQVTFFNMLVGGAAGISWDSFLVR
jgi:NitT/TauT family transport system permease protein